MDDTKEKIREVSIYTLNWFVQYWINKKKCEKCRLLAFDTTFKNWCALDNRTNDCLMGHFKTRQEAIDWLNNEIEKAD